MTSPLQKRWVTELKVKTMTLAVAGTSCVIALLNEVAADNSLLGNLPAYVQVPVVVLIPTVVSYIVGWNTKHTPRPDLAGPQPPVR
jgi:hypothetical protein